MGMLCVSPFNGDLDYDVNVEKEIDSQIYGASLSLYRAEVVVNDHYDNNKW